MVRPPVTEKSYHIFYQMLAGLTQVERMKLGIRSLTVKDFELLNKGDTVQDEEQDAKRFAVWKDSLSVLGIPFLDIVRVKKLLNNIVGEMINKAISFPCCLSR